MLETSPSLRLLAQMTPEYVALHYRREMMRLAETPTGPRTLTGDVLDYHVTKAFSNATRKPLMSEIAAAYSLAGDFGRLFDHPDGMGPG